MPEILIQPPKIIRKFDGQTYVLTKIDYFKQDIEDDSAWYNDQGINTRKLEENGSWLLYTKLGQ